MGQDLSCDTTQIRPFGRSRLRSALCTLMQNAPAVTCSHVAPTPEDLPKPVQCVSHADRTEQP